MKAIQMKEFGGAEVLFPTTLPEPKPGEKEVLIKVKAAGVNRLDILQRRGKYPPPKGASDLLGVEVSGTIVALGEKVTMHKVGEEVCALVSGGGYAEFCCAPEEQVLKIPKSVTLIEAAGIPEAYFTVWSNLFQDKILKESDTFLVHGGSSGIGTVAIQLAKAFGCKVFTTAGTEEKCRRCEELGAIRAINYRTEDFVTVMKESGVNVILDMVGGDYVQKNIDILALDGVLVNIAFQKGTKVELNLSALAPKRLTIKGSTLRSRTVSEKGIIAQELYRYVWPLFEKGMIRPVIDSVFPYEEASKAHQRMEASAHFGKIILTF